jgi:ABC-type transport system substrate-binding protein/ABC-type dipeptide/oligopeptide/nickel transport system permease subunit
MAGAPGRRPFLASSPVLARLLGDRSARLGLALLGALVLFAAVGPLVTPHDPLASDFTLRRDALGGPPGPSLAHPLGTDSLFRDLLARLASGARLSLGIATLATALSVGIGAAVGITAGLAEGGRASFVDGVLMRLVDALLALPFLLFVTAVGAAVGRPDAGTMLLVLGLTGWTGTARIVRDKTMEIRRRDFVVAARSLGAGTLHIVRRHVLPNLTGTLLVVGTLSIGQMILAEAVLSYLTLGTQPPAPSWGRMLHEAEALLSTQLLKVAAPGFAILLTVLATSRVSEGLRDAFEPKQAAPRATRVPFDLVMAAAVLLLVALARPPELAGPIGTVRPEATPARGGTLRVAAYVNLRTLDPALTYDEASRPIESAIFSRLVTWDDQGHIAPDLAERFEVSEDGRTYTFHLKEGVRFHDGAILSAADVVRTMERTLRPGTPSPGASYYESIEGLADFQAGKAEHLAGVRAAGSRTVVFTLREPDATFLSLMTLSFAAPVCPSMGAAVDTRAPAEPCGAGPFRLASFDPESGVRLVRFEGYHVPGRPYLDAIEWITVMPPQTQRYRFEEGSLDVLRELSTSDIARFEADPRWKGHFTWVAGKTTNALFLNTELPPFDNVAMRRAVAYAIDPSFLPLVRAEVAETDRVLPPGIPGPPRDRPMRRHDLAKALEQVALGGYPFDPKTGKGGYPHELEYITVPDSFEQQAAEVYVQQLAKIGLKVRLKLVPFATYLAQVSRRKATVMGWCGWGADFPDPSNFFEPTLSSRAIQDEGSNNVAFFSNEELDRLLLEARKERDRDARMALFLRAEEIVRAEAPWVPTTTSRTPELWQPYVRGYKVHPILPPPLAHVWIDDAARRTADRARGGPAVMFGAMAGALSRAWGRP